MLKVPKYVAGQNKLTIMFSPVAYLRESEVHEQLVSITQSISQNVDFLQSVGRHVVVDTIFTMLITAVVCLKHRGFHEEREWRVIYNPSRGRSPLIDTATEVIGGVPQSIHKLPLDKSVSEDITSLDISKLFDRLIVGPSQYPIAIAEALTTALMQSGVNNAGMRVNASGIPIRT